MQLRIFNGSPRYKKSNSTILLAHFLSGYSSVLTNDVPVHYLAETHQTEGYAAFFSQTETVIVIFPLYTDCMPAIVMAFFEAIYRQPSIATKKLGFIVQSGFPEAIQSASVEKYLTKFTRRIGCEYLGTVIKGGVEGIQMMPPSITKKLFGQFRDLGKYFAQEGVFDPTIMAELRKPYILSTFRRVTFQLFSLLGLTNFYWNTNLKKHHAYAKRFDKPYLPEVL